MKKVNLISLLILASLIISLSSCINCVEPEGEIKDLTVKLDNFTKIDIEIPGNIRLIKGDSSKITISAPKSIISQILPIVKRNRLNLEGNICKVNNEQITIEITVKDISSIKIKGSANVFSDESIHSDELLLKILGSGQISLNVFTNIIESETNGSGSIILSGTSKQLEVDINGSGIFKGLALNAYEAKVKINGSGNASVAALNKLSAKVNGSGEIVYSGSPELRLDISGSGKITKVN